MAASDKIKHDDLIEPGVFNPTIEQARSLLTHVNQLNDGFKQLARSTAKSIAIEPKSVADLNKINEALKRVDVLEKSTQENIKKRLILEEKLSQARTKTAADALAAEAKIEGAIKSNLKTDQRAAAEKIILEQKIQQEKLKTTAIVQSSQNKNAEAAKKALQIEQKAAADKLLAEEKLRQAQMRTASMHEATEKKKQQEIERTKKKIAEESGLIGRLQSNISRLNSLKLQAGTDKQVERINKLLAQQRSELQRLNNVGKQSSNTWTKALDSFQFKFNFLGNLVAGVFANAGASLFNFAKEAFQAAAQAEGIKRAFERLNNPGLLDELREATKGTVSDVKLMQAAVKANNFKLPLDQLAGLFKFAAQRARDTGESVEYLTESIVLGISRKSIPILDNLGLSATQIQQEFKKTGDFAKAVGNIVNEELGKSGTLALTTADKLARMNASWENFKESTGEWLIEGANDFIDFFEVLIGKTSLADAKLRALTEAIANNLSPVTKSIIDSIDSAGSLSGLAGGKQQELTTAQKEVKVNEQITLLREKQLELHEQLLAVKNEDLSTSEKLKKSEGIMAESNAIGIQIAQLAQYKKALLDNKTAVDELTDAEKKAAEERFNNMIHHLELRARLIKDAEERELAFNEIAYMKELHAVKDNAEEKLLVEQYYLEEKARIRQKYSDEWIALEEAETKRITEESEKVAAANKKEIQDSVDEMERLAREEEERITATSEKIYEENQAILAAWRERIEEVAALEELLTNAISDGLDKRYDMRTAALDRENDLLESNIDTQTDLFARGLDNTLAIEQRKRAENAAEAAELAKKKQKQEEALQLASLFLELTKEYAKDGDANAAAKAFAQTLVAKGLATAIAGSAFEGTADTGGPGDVDGKGGRLWVLHPHEAVIRRDRNEDNPGLAAAWNAGKLDDYFRDVYLPQFVGSLPAEDLAPRRQSADVALMTMLNGRMMSLEKTIKNKREVHERFDSLGNLVRAEIEDGQRRETTFKKRVL